MDREAWQTELRARFAAEADAVLERLDELRPSLADPERADADLRAFLNAHDDARDALRRLREDALALELVLRLGSTSRYGFETALREPGAFWAIAGERQYRQVWGRALMASHLARDLGACADAEARRAAVAEFKHRHWLRIILGDVMDALSLEAAVGELSDLTDVAVRACLAEAAARLCARGIPAPEFEFAVLGMGKLGARELNYSSDIDLIFIYDAGEDGPLPAPTARAAGGEEDDADGGRAAAVHDASQRLGAELIRLLDEHTAQGRMFRVDMRLRPEGERGELALSLRESVDYYYSVGRPWERQAMIKARAIAGSARLGERFFAEIVPWIYPSDPQWEDLEEARAMRRRIEERAQAANVKTGAGGIRDIEFLVQYFQLVHGGRAAELRQGATLPVLRLLSDAAILPRPAALELERSYRWLRLVEHRLQMWQDRQEHELPRAAAERAALARRCGMRGPGALEDFDARHAATRARVRELVGRHFLGVTPESEALMALVVQGEADAALAGRVLGEYGFRDIAKACARVRSLAVEPFFVLSRSRTERNLVQLLPGLLARISASPDPDQTLESFARIVSAVGGRATFYELLLDQPRVARLFIELAGWSKFLVELMQDFPGLPDDVIDALNQAPRRAYEYGGQARALIRGIRDLGPPLALLQARETAIIAIRDLEGADADDTAEHLTALAAAILDSVLGRVIQERARAHDVPIEAGRQTRFCVLGLGKLGGHELSYASDMDVLFVCDPGGACAREGGEPMQGDVFWTKVAEDLMRAMSENRLYALDPRLRPYGEKSELVPTTEALRIYWSQEREIWERMAMVRVSHLAGDPRLGEEACASILGPALSQPLGPAAGEQVRAMRRRLEESVSGRDHLKRGPGGYVDHEFIAQFLCLGLARGDLPQPCGTGAMLARLGELGRLDPAAVDELNRGLMRLRAIESRMRLFAGRAISSIPTEPDARRELARRCGYASSAEMDEELARVRAQARDWFERALGAR